MINDVVEPSEQPPAMRADFGSIETAEDVFLLLAAEAAVQRESCLWRVLLDKERRVIAVKMIVDNGADSRVVPASSVFRDALASSAAMLVLVHNHVSGDLKLRDGCCILTDRMLIAGDALGIPVIDHVILTKTEYWSFNEAGYFRDEIPEEKPRNVDPNRKTKG